mmetsp:Transcript_97222/g.275037  ORF Transcript_97222/g.275037 Transcript_97222/m.275037 type:complete len:559 (-) Transcript_97222:52-1728(-)
MPKTGAEGMGNASPALQGYSKFENGDDTLKFLKNVPLFQRLPKELHGELRSCSDSAVFETGQEIITQNSQGDEFFVIKRGKALVTVDGHKITLLSTGDYFGENALLANEPRTATITACSLMEVIKIKREQFQQLGLHEKLEFPRREKVGKRYKMLAGNALKSSLKDSYNRTPLNNQPLVADSQDGTAVRRGYVAAQCNALKEIFTDKLCMTAFVLVPLGQAVAYLRLSCGIIFTVNFLAIIPLASILGQATEALSCHTGQLVGGLLNATFGNAVEMIMCVQAVKKGLVQVVQGNLLGSILSNLLLVLGMAIFAAGTVRKSQEFNAKGAAANMSCQLVASISICLPTVFGYVSESAEGSVLQISRICSVFLMAVYGMFLYFMLKSHAELFADEGEDEHHDGDTLSPLVSTLLLAACTLVVFLCSECLVDSIEPVSTDYGLSNEFIGVILLPIVGNAAEHATAVTCAYKGMMDLALGVAVGSSTQIALFVVPCAVMFGWIFDQPMNLSFTVFDTACQMLTVFLVCQVLSNGETNWLHGAMLMTVYLFIAVQTLFMDGGGE